jgi:5-dehydro-2-deoxygluconokinase
LKTDAAWRNACDAIAKNDPYCRGIVVLGLEAPEAELVESFEVAASFNMVKGFAVGRTIFVDVARDRFKGTISDDQAVASMAQKYRALCDTWDAARKKSGGAA